MKHEKLTILTLCLLFSIAGIKHVSESLTLSSHTSYIPEDEWFTHNSNL